MHPEPRVAARRASLAAGVLFIVTFITSIAALLLFQDVLDDPAGYIAGTGPDGRIHRGVLLELVLLADIKDWTFLLGPGMVVGIGNGLILGYLMYRSALVPRRLAMLGIVGGPLLLAAGVAVLFGAIPAGGTVQSLATVPEFVWELSLGVYLTVKGFAPSPATRDAGVAAVEPALAG